MITKVVVSGGWGYGNLGDEVIAQCTIELINQFFPEAEKYYTSYDVDNFELMHGIKAIESIHSVFAREQYSIDEIDECVLNPKQYGIDEFADLLDEHTLFIMSGGGYFDGRWFNQFAARIIELKLAKKAMAKTAIIGQSIGPLVNRQEKEYLQAVIEECDFVNVRDIESKQLLLDMVPDKEVSCTSDIAVIISDFIKHNHRSEKGKCNLIVQIYTDYVSNGTKGEKNNTLRSKIIKRIMLRQYRYDLNWIRLLRELKRMKAYETNIVLNVQRTGKIGNSHFEKYARKLKKISKYEDLKIINCGSVESFCEALAGAEVIISCKMHPLIVSSSYGVKTYALSQHYKIDAYMRWIGREDACYRNSSFNPKKLAQQILTERNEVQEKSNEMINLRKQEIYQMFGSLLEILSNEK